MTTEAPTQEAPTTEAPAYKLAPPRSKIKTGMPTNGLGIICGLPKGGKTTLVASIPNCTVIEIERGGADRVDGWIQDVPDLVTMRLALKAAVDDPNVKTIAIDSVDVFHEWIDAEVSAAFGLESVGESKEGVNGFDVWKVMRARYEGLVSYLKASGKLCILIAHSKEPKIDKDGKVVIPAGITIPGKLGGYLAAEADFIGNVFKKQVGSNTVHYLSFQGGPLGTWGSRIQELEDKIIALPKTNQWSAVEAIFAAAQPKDNEKKQAATAVKKGDK